MNGFDDGFWEILDSLVNDSEIVIDRPKGTTHPKYSNFIYKVDQGYLKNSSSMDGAGIDVWVGSGKKQLVYQIHNETQWMKGILIRR